MFEVELTWFELAMSTNVGRQRGLEACRKNCRDTIGIQGADNFQNNIVGAVGEQALASALNIYWSGSINTFKIGGDVGDLQVRTRTRDDYQLIVRDKDRDNDVFILVRGQIPRFRVVGWMYGRDAKRKEFIKNHGGYGDAYFVPDESLRPIEELRAVIRAQE